MSYPSTSDFTAPSTDAFNPPAWWTYTRSDGSLNVCETTGAAALRRIRGVLGLSSDPIWDASVQAALLAQAQNFASSQPSAGWTAIASALSQNSVSTLAMQFAIWLAYYQANGMRLDAVGIPPGSVLPTFGIRVADSGGDALTCFDPQQDPAPGVLSQTELNAAQNQSSYGIRLHPGESPPAPTPPVPPGPAGLSTGAIVGILVAVVAGVAIVSYVNRKRVSPPKANPRRASYRTR